MRGRIAWIVVLFVLVAAPVVAMDASDGAAPADAPVATPEAACEACGGECTGEWETASAAGDGPVEGGGAQPAAPVTMSAPQAQAALAAAGSDGPRPGSMEMAARSVSQMTATEWRNTPESVRNHWLGLGLRPHWMPAPPPPARPVDHLADLRERETLTGGPAFAPPPPPLPPRDTTPRLMDSRPPPPLPPAISHPSVSGVSNAQILEYLNQAQSDMTRANINGMLQGINGAVGAASGYRRSGSNILDRNPYFPGYPSLPTEWMHPSIQAANDAEARYRYWRGAAERAGLLPQPPAAPTLNGRP